MRNMGEPMARFCVAAIYVELEDNIGYNKIDQYFVFLCHEIIFSCIWRYP